MLGTPSFAAPILARVWQFRSFSTETLDVLAAHASREIAPKGAVIIAEGDGGTDAFVVIEGRLEVQLAGRNGPLPVAVLNPDDLFGEVAIVAGRPERRTASVVAQTPVVLLRIDGTTFSQAIASSPHVREQLEAAADRMAVGRFIKSATLLGDLPPAELHALSERVHERHVASGEVVILRGDPGEECFLVRAGELDVIDDSGDQERHLATLRTGMLFGEAAILTGAPRNATVRATSDVRLLVLRRDDVMAAMSSEHDVANHLAALMQARSRPRKRPGIELHERASADGTPIVTLKDPTRGTYFRLSREGAFVWGELDGKHTVRDLTMDLFLAYKVLAPDVVMDIIRHLAAEGFIDVERIDAVALAAPNRRQKVVRSFVAFMEYSYSLNNCDAFFTLLYERFGRYAFTRAGAIVAAAIAAGGFAAFVAMAERSASTLLQATNVARVSIALIPLIVIAIVTHELGHGVAAKAAGARVHRVGLGWFWFRMMFFVDTSDAWLANRQQRMLVDAGGILVNLVMAGLSGFVALLATDSTVAALAWTFALWSYIGVMRNLNPLLEYDGYYLLMDALERPNLRGRSLGWIATGLPAALRKRTSLRGHRIELWYAFGALLYVGFVFTWSLFTYRFTAQGWVARIAPAEYAPLIGRLLAFALGGIALFRLCSDIWTERARIYARARHAAHKG
jgi:putative peptide zinc metalloprotease protein